MRVIFLPTLWTIFLDFAVWFAVHLLSAWIAVKLPDRCFAQDRGIFRTRDWEKDGRFWQDAFRVKNWKKGLPDGASLMKAGFVKKRLLSSEAAWMDRFVLESRRAEFTHVLAMIPALLFFLWNPWPVGLFMIFYALAANLPCLIAQRYNRPRFQRALKKKLSMNG
jgi:glycosyl-4,4'-diaponeurosporenoate acyltransferase